MAKIYYIGGAPRSGKSTVAQALIASRPMFAASTDAIRTAVKAVLAPAQNPKYFKTERGAFGSKNHLLAMEKDPEQALKYELDEAYETWGSTQDFISYYQRDGKDIAIEGVGVLPEQLANVDYPFKAVFIVHLTDQTQTIVDHTMSNPDDWLSKYDERTIRAFSSFNLRWNKFIAEQARKYNFSVVEVDSNNFQTNVNSAVEVLLDKR